MDCFEGFWEYMGKYKELQKAFRDKRPKKILAREIERWEEKKIRVIQIYEVNPAFSAISIGIYFSDQGTVG